MKAEFSFIGFKFFRVFFMVLVLGFSFSTLPAKAQEYELYGDLKWETSFFSGEQSAYPVETWAENLLNTEFNHRLYGKYAEFFAHHAVTGDATAFGAGSVDLKHNLFELYGRFDLTENLAFYGGKQIINWGVGYAFHPSDALHPSRLYKKDEFGFTGLSLLLTPDTDMSFAAAVSMDKIMDGTVSGSSDYGVNQYWEDLKYAGYGSVFFAGVDFALSYVFQLEEISRPGVSITWEFVETIVSFEAATELSDLSEPEAAFDGALERSWFLGDFSITGIGEYVYSMKENFLSGLKDQHYLHLALAFGLVDSFNWNNAILMNLEDPSAQINHEIIFYPDPIMDLGAKVVWTAGSKKTEFGGLPFDIETALSMTIHF